MRRLIHSTATLATITILTAASSIAPTTALATGDNNETACPNENMTGYSTNLPDCRAYEQVSPPEKDGGSGGVLNFGSSEQENKRLPMQSLPEGTAITYPGEPFYNSPVKIFGEEKIEQYTSTRSTTGWKTESGDGLPLESAPAPLIPASVAPAPTVEEETPTGSRILYLEGGDLYEYSTSSEKATDLTPDLEPGGADVQGILGTGGEGSEEGSYVYFVAGGALARGTTTGECIEEGSGAVGVGVGIGCKLYLSHDGTITYVTTFSRNDNSAGFKGVYDWKPPSSRSAEVSPNGHFVAFGSVLELTGQPTEKPEEPEIFRYDAESGGLICVSCSPTGAPVARAVNQRSSTAAINGANRQRYMLNDGRVIFDTTAALVTQDTNHQLDVYEWEEDGPHLISAGTSETDPSVFTDASVNSSDIFFTTGQSLVPADKDEITDLYDAREDGGFPPPTPPACPADAVCPGALPTAPILDEAPVPVGVEAPPLPTTIKSLPHKPRPMTRAQKLAKALSACRAARNRKKRAACDIAAHRQYGPISRTKTKRRSRR
jgi:hypothetical protein